MRRILSRSTRSLTPLTRSHAPRGNAIFDAPRRARRDTPQSGKAAFPRGAWERVKAWERVNRAGFSLLEMFVAVVVFGTVLMTFLPLMQSVGNQQRITDQRLLALREANNLLEQLSVRQWSELSSDELVKISLPEDVRSRLPQAGMQIELAQVLAGRMRIPVTSA